MLDRKKILESVEKTTHYSNIFEGKKVYIKSTVQYKGSDFYTNYNEFNVENIEFSPDYIYVYGPSNDKIIIDEKTITSIDEPVVGTIIITSEVNGFTHRFEMKII